MPAYTSPILRLRLSALGEDLNSWGDPNLNNAFYRIEDALGSILTLPITGDVTLTSDNYVANQYRRHALKLTGSPTAAFTITVPAVSYPYRFINQTAQQATIKTSTGQSAIVRAGRTTTVLCDGLDCTALDPTLDQIKAAAGPVSFGGFKGTNQAPGLAATDSATLANSLDQFASAVSPLTIPNGTAPTHAVNVQQLQTQVFNIGATPGGSAVGQVPRWIGSGYSPGAVDLANTSAVTGSLPLANGGTGSTSASTARTALGLGTAATQNVGTAAGNVVQLDGSGNLPAVGAGNLTGIKYVNRAYAELTAYTSVAENIPADDTIPQSNEGTQVLTTSITPKSTTNRLRVRFFLPISFSSGGATAIAAVFAGAATNAIYATRTYGNLDSGTGTNRQIDGEFEFVPATTSSTSISLRVGASSGNLLLNGDGAAAARMLGGAMRATLIVDEIAP